MFLIFRYGFKIAEQNGLSFYIKIKKLKNVLVLGVEKLIELIIN